MVGVHFRANGIGNFSGSPSIKVNKEWEWIGYGIYLGLTHRLRCL